MSNLVLVIDNLDVVPRSPLPEGYTTRFYKAGDSASWGRIHADLNFYEALPPDQHTLQFGDDQKALAERQIFVVDGEGNDVATATAWLNNPIHGVPGGRIHWVAVAPTAQRRGIASAMLGILCDRFAELGETTAYLTTDSENSRAVAMYEGLGFRIERRLE